ncbi:tRNA(Ser) Um(44) 2'-O-methyltransferase [Ascosphaera acerosa]|nr:tRNA(Ser) Um(44) 2'-O-methyltransferase [Ascosphaera acerosa]
MRNWVESTEPAKHVFEDLSIAAFLCELWQRHYHAGTETDARDHAGKRPWPGFVDIACGNGVLVYILHQEGFEGWGFDARRRKTWSILPQATQARLREMIYFPQPFRAVAESADGGAALADPVFDGILTRETFIISNHADELTLWTPIIGALSDPACPMPFLAIPCCSHSLSGARYRYPPPKHVVPVKVEQDNPVTGDLKAMAAERRQERADPGVGYSAYASLTARLVRIAQEVGYDDVDRTLLRIPSTRNIAVVAGVITRPQRQVRDACQARAEMEEKVHDILAADCQRNGGVETAAQAWLNRALSLQQPGRSQQSAKALG